MSSDKYVRFIMRDETEKIAREATIVYGPDRIEREYEFQDGAVVKYEWQDKSLRGYNHRFSLVRPPKPNPEKLSAGVIETIDY